MPVICARWVIVAALAMLAGCLDKPAPPGGATGTSRHWVERTDNHGDPVQNASMTYFPPMQEMLVYGGNYESDSDEDTMYALGSDGWTAVPFTNGPGMREGAAFAYDPTRQVAVLFGGNASGDRRTFEWNGTDWVTGDMGPAEATIDPTFVFAPALNKLLLVGGADKDAYSLATYTYDGSWSAPVTGLPQPVCGPGTHVVYDTTQQAFIAFADDNGMLTALDTVLSSTDGLHWVEQCTQCGAPRIDGSLTYDPILDRTVLVSGTTPETNNVDIAGTLALGSAGWSVVDANDPPARDAAVTAYDPDRNVIVMYGGNADSCTAAGEGGGNGDCWETWEMVLDSD